MTKIVDRVRKLLELSKRNDSPTEAAQAAAMAQELMFKFQIGETDLETKETREPEAVVEETAHTEKGRKRCVWKSSLAHAIAQGFGCEMFTMRDTDQVRFQIFGTKSAVQTVGYMYGYLALEVTRLAEVAYREARGEIRESPKTWKNNYRLGCVAEIRERLAKQREEQAKVVEDLVREQPKGAGLVLYKSDEARVKDGYKKLKQQYGLRTRTNTYRYSPSAYERGRAAGRSLSLGGGRGLPGSPNRLEG